MKFKLIYTLGYRGENVIFEFLIFFNFFTWEYIGKQPDF